MAEKNTNDAALNDSELEKVSGGGLTFADSANGALAKGYADNKLFDKATKHAEAIDDPIYRAYILNYIKSKQTQSASAKL